jgi:hypothetical protein
MRTKSGYDLHRVLGKGLYGVVVEVSHEGQHFAVKDQSSRRNVLVEAALLNFGTKFHGEAGKYAIGPFARLCGCGTDALLSFKLLIPKGRGSLQWQWNWQTFALAKSSTSWANGSEPRIMTTPKRINFFCPIYAACRKAA